jgi:hypothetical protein
MTDLTLSILCHISFEVSSEDPALDLLAAPETVFLLRAARDLQKGEEVTICYDQVI